MMGYLIEYKLRTSITFADEPGDNYSEERKALVSAETLSRMLASWQYLIFTARIVEDMDEYRDENGKQIEIITEAM